METKEEIPEMLIGQARVGPDLAKESQTEISEEEFGRNRLIPQDLMTEDHSNRIEEEAKTAGEI